MSRPDIQPPAPGDEFATAEAIRRLIEMVDGQISFGSPQDPNDPAGTDRAGSSATAHPGTLENMEGAWVEIEVTTVPSTVTCHHRLNQPVQAAGEPNVRWLLWGNRHSGAGVATAGPSVAYVGGTVNVDDIQLDVYFPGATVDGPNPLRLSLWFQRAVN